MVADEDESLRDLRQDAKKSWSKMVNTSKVGRELHLSERLQRPAFSGGSERETQVIVDVCQSNVDWFKERRHLLHLLPVWTMRYSLIEVPTSEVSKFLCTGDDGSGSRR